MPGNFTTLNLPEVDRLDGDESDSDDEQSVKHKLKLRELLTRKLRFVIIMCSVLFVIVSEETASQDNFFFLMCQMWMLLIRRKVIYSLLKRVLNSKK